MNKWVGKQTAAPQKIVGQTLPKPLSCAECDESIDCGEYRLLAVSPDEIGSIARPTPLCSNCRTPTSVVVTVEHVETGVGPKAKIREVFERVVYLGAERGGVFRPPGE